MVDTVKVQSFQFGHGKKVSDLQSDIQGWITAQSIVAKAYAIWIEGSTVYIMAFVA